MSFEEEIKAKHAFEESFEVFLRYLSVMTIQELELAAAKLADAISTGETKQILHQQSYLVKQSKLYYFFERTVSYHSVS